MTPDAAPPQRRVVKDDKRTAQPSIQHQELIVRRATHVLLRVLDGVARGQRAVGRIIAAIRALHRIQEQRLPLRQHQIIPIHPSERGRPVCPADFRPPRLGRTVRIRAQIQRVVAPHLIRRLPRLQALGGRVRPVQAPAHRQRHRHDAEGESSYPILFRFHTFLESESNDPSPAESHTRSDLVLLGVCIGNRSVDRVIKKAKATAARINTCPRRAGGRRTGQVRRARAPLEGGKEEATLPVRRPRSGLKVPEALERKVEG